MNNTDDLIKQALDKIDGLNTDNYIGYQIRQHIELYREKGIGREVLIHYLEHDRLYIGHKVFYYNGIIIDRNKMKYQFYSRANRHNEWLKVKKILPKTKSRNCPRG